MQGQVGEFWCALLNSMQDDRTLADIIEDEKGVTAGYIWVPFHTWENGTFCAEIQDIYIATAFRRQGIAGHLLTYAAAKAKENGAKILRSGTGCGNRAAIKLHEKAGFGAYRYELEKML